MDKVLRPRFMTKRVNEETVTAVCNLITLKYPNSVNNIRCKYADIVDMSLLYVSLKDAIRGLMSMGINVENII